MIRDGFEKGLASIVARWMLDGSAQAVIDRVAKSGALPPEQLEKLRADTLDHLHKVRDEGAPYADMATAALREIVGHVPLGSLWSGAVAAAASVPWKEAAAPAAQAAARAALHIAARSAEAAAARAQELAAHFAVKPATAAAADADAVAASSSPVPPSSSPVPPSSSSIPPISVPPAGSDGEANT